MSEPEQPHVVVVGAGYAGAHAARAALDEGASVTVIDHSGRHDFTPRLAAVAGGTRAVGDAWAEVGDLLDARVVRGTVTGIDRDRRRVAVGPDVDVTYGSLVLTVGAEPVVPDVPGASRDTLALRTTEDALAVREALADAGELVVIGGGATGVQLAGEAAAAHPDLTVHIVERESRLLPEFGWLLAVNATRILRKRGVQVHVDAKVTAVHPGRVVLEDERELPGVIVWAAGFSAAGNQLLPGAATDDGRLVVDQHLRLPDDERIFAAGDVALHRDLLDRVLPMSAQVARQAGRVAGRNAARAARENGGRDLRPARLVDWGWVIDLGGGAGVARVGPFPIALPPADRLVPLLHGAVDLRHLFEVGGVGAVLGHAPGRHRVDGSSRVRSTDQQPAP